MELIITLLACVLIILFAWHYAVLPTIRFFIYIQFDKYKSSLNRDFGDKEPIKQLLLSRIEAMQDSIKILDVGFTYRLYRSIPPEVTDLSAKDHKAIFECGDNSLVNIYMQMIALSAICIVINSGLLSAIAVILGILVKGLNSTITVINNNTYIASLNHGRIPKNA